MHEHFVVVPAECGCESVFNNYLHLPVKASVYVSFNGGLVKYVLPIPVDVSNEVGVVGARGVDFLDAERGHVDHVRAGYVELGREAEVGRGYLDVVEVPEELKVPVGAERGVRDKVVSAHCVAGLEALETGGEHDLFEELGDGGTGEGEELV